MMLAVMVLAGGVARVVLVVVRAVVPVVVPRVVLGLVGLLGEMVIVHRLYYRRLDGVANIHYYLN